MEDDSVTEWQPAPSAPTADDLLDAAARQRDAGDSPVDPGVFADDRRERLRAAMHLGSGPIETLVDDLDGGALEALIRFFTRIEEQPGWESGERSPVVPLFRRWRRDVPADDARALARWVKAHTDNRFLPHGSLQDRLRV